MTDLNELADLGRYRIKQDGMPVASAEGPNAHAEIMHYAMVYGQDGPVEIEQHRNGRWRKLAATPVQVNEVVG